MAHLIDSMAYTGQTPWHGLGNVLPPQQSLDVWLQAAGMDSSGSRSNPLACENSKRADSTLPSEDFRWSKA